MGNGQNRGTEEQVPMALPPRWRPSSPLAWFSWQKETDRSTDDDGGAIMSSDALELTDSEAVAIFLAAERPGGGCKQKPPPEA
jgi:hypothetical protein